MSFHGFFSPLSPPISKSWSRCLSSSKNICKFTQLLNVLNFCSGKVEKCTLTFVVVLGSCYRERMWWRGEECSQSCVAGWQTVLRGWKIWKQFADRFSLFASSLTGSASNTTITIRHQSFGTGNLRNFRTLENVWSREINWLDCDG